MTLKSQDVAPFPAAHLACAQCLVARPLKVARIKDLGSGGPDGVAQRYIAWNMDMGRLAVWVTVTEVKVVLLSAA